MTHEITDEKTPTTKRIKIPKPPLGHYRKLWNQEMVRIPVSTRRNAPCPCGSNKKFKLCCGRKKKPGQTNGSSALEMDRLKLIRLPGGATLNNATDGKNYQEILAQKSLGFNAHMNRSRTLRAIRLFWDNPGLSQEDMKDIEQDAFFFDWLYFDCPVTPGKTLIDLHLSKVGKHMFPDEVVMMQTIRDTCLTLYEVEAAPEGYALRDVLTDQIRNVSAPDDEFDTPLVYARIADFIKPTPIFSAALDYDALSVLKTFHREDYEGIRTSGNCPDLTPDEYWKNFAYTGFLFYREEISSKL